MRQDIYLLCKFIEIFKLEPYSTGSFPGPFGIIQRMGKESAGDKTFFSFFLTENIKNILEFCISQWLTFE